MAFKLTDAHIDEYHRCGFTVFRNLIPPALLRDLRVMAEKAREICRKQRGPQAQRLQPIQKFDLDLKSYYAYAELPELVDAIEKLIGPDAIYAYKDRTSKESYAGILFEPEERPYCTIWHRDWRDNIGGLSIKAWESHLLDVRMYNQVNTPLYDDGCTWIVPGSHLRRDLAAEIRRFPERPIKAPDTSGMAPEEAEWTCLQYCESMPGNFQAHLHAGDFMLYRNSLWHIGSYAPYRKRATIHDVVWTNEFIEWWKSPPKREDGRPEMLNPNVDRPEYQALKTAAV